MEKGQLTHDARNKRVETGALLYKLQKLYNFLDLRFFLFKRHPFKVVVFATFEPEVQLP